MSTERAAQHTSGAVNHDRARVEQDGRDSEREAGDSEQQRAGGSATAGAECEDWGGAGDGIKGDPQRAGPALVAREASFAFGHVPVFAVGDNEPVSEVIHRKHTVRIS